MINIIGWIIWLIGVIGAWFDLYTLFGVSMGSALGLWIADGYLYRRRK